MDQTPMQVQTRGARRWFQFSLRTIFIVMTLVALALGLFVVPMRREAVKRACASNLEGIGRCLSNYRLSMQRFPCSYDQAETRGLRRWHSWRTQILGPLCEHTPMEKYIWNEPWDGPWNSKLHGTDFQCFLCPTDAASPRRNTSYLAIVGEGTAWPITSRPPHEKDFKNGLARAIAAVEVWRSGVHWMEPKDLELDQIEFRVNATPTNGISSGHVGGANSVFADGSARFLSNRIDPNVLKALIRIDEDNSGVALPPPTGLPQ